MSRHFPDLARVALPEPYRSAIFTHRRHGLFDDPDIDVFTDSEGTFAVLHPQPTFEYARYVPRQQKLGLGAYKKTMDVISRRFAKIGDLIPPTGTLIEIGAADGSFLAMLQSQRPNLRLISVEPDLETQAARRALALAGDYADLAAVAAAGVKADVVCLFHVFEHIDNPRSFLDAVRPLLLPGGRVIIEVPSLDDPLLSLYALPAYEDFYFQRQHPFVYSSRSLSRVMTANGFKVEEMRPYQRYGLENHLAWLRSGKPGGDVLFADTFVSVDSMYKAALEAKGATDTVFAVAVPG